MILMKPIWGQEKKNKNKNPSNKQTNKKTRYCRICHSHVLRGRTSPACAPSTSCCRAGSSVPIHLCSPWAWGEGEISLAPRTVTQEWLKCWSVPVSGRLHRLHENDRRSGVSLHPALQPTVCHQRGYLQQQVQLLHGSGVSAGLGAGVSICRVVRGLGPWSGCDVLVHAQYVFFPKEWRGHRPAHAWKMPQGKAEKSALWTLVIMCYTMKIQWVITT